MDLFIPTASGKHRRRTFIERHRIFYRIFPLKCFRAKTALRTENYIHTTMTSVAIAEWFHFNALELI